jgi:MFS transporter, DHA3 family, multidrug efflux protein
MKTFYQLLANVLIVGITNNFIWFALTFWIYTQTQSVISTGFVGGIYLIATALSGFWFGSLVDHYKKKHVMLGAGIASLVLYCISLAFYLSTPGSLFTFVGSPLLWVLVLLLMGGVIAGNVFNIAIPTLVTILVPEDRRDRANGMFGTVTGVGFTVTSAASGLILGFGGMFWVLITAIVLMALALVHLFLVPVLEKSIVHLHNNQPKNIDIRGTIKVVLGVPGLVGLLIFNTFNNFLGGVFMALMDAYGLSLVSIEVWGVLLAILSFGFIIGGMVVAKKGLGKNPLRTLFLANMVMWTVCIFFAAQPWVWLLALGMLTWMSLVPFIEAAEQTIIQKVVPLERQGRVFGFAQSTEQAASPLTAFLIGPITQLIFIPFMTNGRGVDLIGGWFGVGVGRGIALVFIATGVIGLIVTILAMQTKAYKLLTKRYLK